MEKTACHSEIPDTEKKDENNLVSNVSFFKRKYFYVKGSQCIFGDVERRLQVLKDH